MGSVIATVVAALRTATVEGADIIPQTDPDDAPRGNVMIDPPSSDSKVELTASSNIASLASSEAVPVPAVVAPEVVKPAVAAAVPVAAAAAAAMPAAARPYPFMFTIKFWESHKIRDNMSPADLDRTQFWSIARCGLRRATSPDIAKKWPGRVAYEALLLHYDIDLDGAPPPVMPAAAFLDARLTASDEKGAKYAYQGRLEYASVRCLNLVKPGVAMHRKGAAAAPVLDGLAKNITFQIRFERHTVVLMFKCESRLDFDIHSSLQNGLAYPYVLYRVLCIEDGAV
jgi:hypothetical protein